MEIQELSNKELKIIVLKILRYLQNNTNEQFNETRKEYKKMKSSMKRYKTKKRN